MAAWTDTDFTNINSGGNYTNWYQFPTFHSWDTSVPGEIKDSNGYNIAAVRTADSATGEDQYIEFTVADVSRTYEACVRHPTTVTSGEFRGYWCRIQQSGGQWWKNNGYEGGLATHSYSGAGTIRLEVESNVCRLYIQGNLVDTKDYSSAPITSDDAHVGFGVAGSGPNPTISYAEGGDIPPPNTDVPASTVSKTGTVYTPTITVSSDTNPVDGYRTELTLDQWFSSRGSLPGWFAKSWHEAPSSVSDTVIPATVSAAGTIPAPTILYDTAISNGLVSGTGTVQAPTIDVDNARSTIYPEPQADGDLTNGWTFPFFPSQERLQEVGGWITTDSNAAHSAFIVHDITNTGDWQISFTSDSSAANSTAVLLLDSSYNGVYLTVSDRLQLRIVNAGTPTGTIIDVAKVAGSHVSTFIEWTYEAATNTHTIYENGASQGSVVDGTYEANDKIYLAPLNIASTSPTNEGRIKDLFIQRYIDVVGTAPGSGTNISASTVSATGTTYSPTITTSVTISVGLVSGTGTVQSPSISALLTLPVGLVSGTGTTNGTTITTTADIAGGVVSGTGTTNSTTNTASGTTTPAVITGTGSTNAPTLSASTITFPSVVNGTGSVNAHVITATANIAGSVVTGTGTTYDPLAGTLTIVEPAVISGSGTIFNPVMTSTAIISGAVISGTGTVNNVSISASGNAAASTISTTGSVFNPIITATAIASASLLSSVGTVYTPILTATATVTAGLLTGTGTVQSPTPNTGTNVPVVTITGTGTVYTPTLSWSSAAIVATISATGVVHNITVTTQTNVTAGLVSGTGTTQTSTISSSPTVFAATVTGTGSVSLSSPGNQSSVSVDVISGVGTINNISIMASGNVSATLVSGIGSTQAPTTMASTTTNAGVVTGTGSVGDSTEEAMTYVTLSQLLGSGSVYTPINKASADITPTTISSTGATLNPSINTSLIILANHLIALGETFAADIVTNTNISAETVIASAQVFDSTLSAVLTIMADVILASVSVEDPYVTGVGFQDVTPDTIEAIGEIYLPTIIKNFSGLFEAMSLSGVTELSSPVAVAALYEVLGTYNSIQAGFTDIGTPKKTKGFSSFTKL